VGEELKESRIGHARFNGELDVKRRDLVLNKFCTPINERQGGLILRNINRIEVKLQDERAAQKAALEREAANASSESNDTSNPTAVQQQSQDVDTAASTASAKKTPSLLDSLRAVDRSVMAKSNGLGASTKGKGKQRAQEEDVYGDNPSVLLISMGCGALGLNLRAASTVILLDPWWQSSLESQAIDRTHRIGQTRNVKVFQIICEHTVEARVLEIQQTKEGLAETAFSGLRATGSTADKREKLETSMKDLGRLFGMTEEQVNNQLIRNAAGASRS